MRPVAARDILVFNCYFAQQERGLHVTNESRILELYQVASYRETTY